MRRRVLVTLMLAGTILSACAADAGVTTGEGTIDMDHLVFQTDDHRIPVGGTITFANTASRALHVLVVGKDAQPRLEPGAPSFGGASGHRSEVGDRWTTPPWNTPGTFSVTCTLHPSMNLKVVVG